MGSTAPKLQGIDVTSLRNGKQVSLEQSLYLTAPVDEKETLQALKSIKHLTNPGTNGYSAKFFKATWRFTNTYIINPVQEFFVEEHLYKPFISTLVTLIPKVVHANTIKDYRSISCRKTLYKIISKIMTTRLGKVLGIIINNSQAAFVPKSTYSRSHFTCL